MQLDPHDIYYGLASLGMVAAFLGFLIRAGRHSGAIESKLDSIHEDVVEIKTNHLPHLDARIQSIEEHLRK